MVKTENKKIKNELEKQVEASIKAKKEKALAEWRELQQDKKKVKAKRSKVMTEIDLRYSADSTGKYKNSLWDKIRLFDKQLAWLDEVQKEMLYENYFLKHSKGIVKSTTSSGEHWDDKYYYDIRDILAKWYRKCMSGVNDFGLGYEGASDNDIDQDYNMGGISTSSWEFVGNFVYKIIREISEPKLHFRNFEGGDNEYHGILYRNLYDWRKQKGFIESVNSVKVDSKSIENDPTYQAGFKAGMKSGGNWVLNQVPENVLDEWEDNGYLKGIDQQLGNDTTEK